MTRANDEWKVLPHGPIVKLAENLWWVQGSLPSMSLKRTMVVARHADGQLTIHSAIALEDSALKELEAFGEPSYLVVPSAIHRLDAPAFKRRYPKLRVFAPAGALEQVRSVVAVDGSYEDFPRDTHIWLERLHGVKDREGLLLVRSRDGLTAVLNDVVFNMDKKKDLMGWLITSLFGSAPGPRVSRLSKLALIDDRKALRRDLEQLAARPELVRLVVAHEKVAHGPDAAAALRQAATYL